MLEVKYKIWIDKEGKVFGQGPYRLLQGVQETGSLSEAAKNMSMSYNKAYNLIRDIEGRLGYKLIISKSGGYKGGGSQLTSQAEKLMNIYIEFYTKCQESIQNIFDEHFKNITL